jgi:cobalamin biosynthesis Mg chelatase CobN
MRSSSSSAHQHPENSQNYMPSVPLSVYRELALELQATQATIDALKSQNQQLAKQNHYLRQEIEKVVQHVSYLQQVVDTTVANQTGDRVERHQVKPKRPPSGSRAEHQGAATPAKTSGGHPPEFVAIEEVEVNNSHRRSQPESPARMSGWGLTIAVSIVVVTAFSTGFLLVRPLASNR